MTRFIAKRKCFSHSRTQPPPPQHHNETTPPLRPVKKKSRGKIKGGISEKIVSFIRQRYTDPIKTNYISGKNTLAKVFRHFIFIDVDAYRVGCKFLSSFRYKFICIVVLHQMHYLRKAVKRSGYIQKKQNIYKMIENKGTPGHMLQIPNMEKNKL